MNMEELAKEYNDAWNQQDVDGLLALMHPGAAVYDAFWMENCVGRDIAQFFQDTMDEEPYWYERVGDLIITESSVVIRYNVYDRSESKMDEPIHHGATVLVIRDNKILTVTDFYCSSNPAELREVAELVAKRHGVPTHTKFGMSALKAMRVKAKLSAKLDEDKVYLDPGITISELAARIGCSVDQLSVVIDQQFGTSFLDILDTRRIKHASELLEVESDDPNIVTRTAAQAGFKSVEEFSDKFTNYFGITPSEFCRRHNKKDNSVDNSKFH